MQPIVILGLGLGGGDGAGAGFASATTVLGAGAGLDVAGAVATDFFSVNGLESQWPLAVADAGLAAKANRLIKSSFRMPLV